MDLNAQNKLDMASARSKTSISVENIMDLLYNGRDEWDSHSGIIRIMSEDPVFDKSTRIFMNRTERFERGLAITARVFELAGKYNWTTEQISHALFQGSDESLPIGLHYVAFEPVMLSQASPELLEKYGELIVQKGIIGCYLQTELGHGSNVAHLETTATYIPETKEFEIHSPTLTSSKWWIGGLGKFATHGVVQAKLILPGGKDVGPHLFLVQLRSLENHKAMPGLVLGDIGPKELGGNAPLDNGFARFDHVRIPKENMLSKFAGVTDAGEYVKPPHAKISYGGMLYIRSTMVTEAGRICAKAAITSIRFGTVRRQGNKSNDGLEAQIISYPSVHYRLLPILSHAYVFTFLGRQLISSFSTMSSRLAKGDTSLLAEIHAITSGLKVLVTTTAINDIEVARRSMGGHGYSGFSGLGKVYSSYLPSATYEGDNFVLDQQVVRAALKSYKAFTSTKLTVADLSPSTYYLRLLRETRPTQNTLLSELSYKSYILLLEWRAALVVRETFLHQKELETNRDQRVAKAVTEAFVASQVGTMIESLDSNDLLSARDRHVLRELYTLYLLTTVESALVDLLSLGLIESGPSSRKLRAIIASLCQAILPEAIGLTDSFGFSDWELDSATGVYDGSVYQSLWDKAQTEPLNQTEVTPGYETYIKPILVRGQRLANASAKL